MTLRLRIPVLFTLAICCALGRAQSGSFNVSDNGTTVGTATFDVKSTPNGYDSNSLVRVSMAGLNYTLSKTEKLDPNNRLSRAVLSGTVNSSAVNIIARPDGGQILVNISANGRATTNRLDQHPNSVVLADFDAGALETLLVMAAQQNNRDLWAILPKNSGSIEAVRLATYADQHGTMDGKPITVHHLVATIAGAKTDLFSGPENQLLQAELPQPGFALVRKGFVLTMPTKPGAPPPDAQTPQGPPQQPQASPPKPNVPVQQ
jgi:hypothetical protein